MPTYEYECDECGLRFEKFQKMTEKQVKYCPKCKGTVHKLISAGAGVIYKGSGFHVNDYKNVSNTQTRCGKDQTCCGHDIPCDTPPCDK